MGIVNVTPDSFYDGGKNTSDNELLSLVDKHLKDGADFIDIGGYSSRPGAKDISVDEELNRLVPSIEAIIKRFPDCIISVDTFRSKVAEHALQTGASIINDISAYELDNQMPQIAKKYGAPYIIMHMQGTPQTMQKNPSYINVTSEIISFFSTKLLELKAIGVNDIIIDPGFGFGKTIEHNFELLKNLKQFSILNTPILCGLSRKSMIWKILKTTPEESLNGTSILNGIALLNGCNILRVHDVKEAKESIELIKMLE
jgi:dihydropteroate synthase